MTSFFLTLVNMSISAGWIVLAVLLLRLILKKAPKWIAVLLWGIVALRLICPFTVESVLSLIPSAQTVSPSIMTDDIPTVNIGIPVINEVVIPISAKLEADIAELDDPEEKAMFMEELGLNESGLDKLIRSSYALLGLISFLTAGSDECRAWTIKRGTKAPQAAGKIHTDFERGFIRAEVIAFEDMKACGTMANAKAKGLVRSEGKEYVMKDGDIVNFLFNV